MTLIEAGHLKDVPKDLFQALLYQAIRGGLGPAEFRLAQDLLAFLRRAEEEKRFLVGVLEGEVWGVDPLLLSLDEEGLARLEEGLESLPG